MISYATSAQLGTWVPAENLPDNTLGLLRSATILVAFACFRNPYTDPAPTGTDVQVLADATCAQAASWIALGLDPNQLGLATAPVKSSTILGATVERDTTGQALAQQKAASMLSPEACAILTLAGLIYEPVPVASDSNDLPFWGSDRPFTEIPPAWSWE